MSETVLLMGPLLPATMSALDSNYDVHRLWESDNPDALLASIADTCTGIVTDGGRGVQTQVLEQLPKLGVVSVFGVGVDAVDLEYCKANDIRVGNTPDVLSDDVADMAVALALATCRKMVLADAYVRAGRWPTDGAMKLTVRMTGKRAGIYGMGSIGDSLAQRLSGFDMDIAYCNRRKKADSRYRFVPSLLQLARDVDFLFVTAAATSDTIGSINAEVLDALGPEAYLINVARGTLVDEIALLECLESKSIAGAGLDVFAEEPQVPDAFYQLDNVVMQPHNASGTHETRAAMGKLMLDNLAAFFEGRNLLTQVV
jgi:lactate dehydrogenase-like 2-hydroxyacid dehydrogenase